MSAINELAVNATIISFYPDVIPDERKPGLIPAFYTINAGDLANKIPGLTLIPSVERNYWINDDLGNGKEFVPASQLAQSLVHDFIISSIGINREEGLYPGIFWLPGSLALKEIQLKHGEILEENYQRQINWFKGLVRMADDDWSRTRQHRSITKIQKTAAEFLKLDREWLTDQEVAKSLSKCPVCMTKVEPSAIKCYNCQHILNLAAFKEIQAETNKAMGVK